MLERYVHALGIDLFNEESYLPSDAVLVEKAGALPEGVHTYSLEAARVRF
jgi:hypothetical protein